MLLDIAVGHDDDVLREPKAPYGAVDLLCGPSPVGALWHNHQHIEIAVYSHLPPGSRAEKDDAPGMDRLHDATDQFVDHFRIRVHRHETTVRLELILPVLPGPY